MAYFDSPKNRAFWERELQVLRPEREARSKTGFQPTARMKETAEVNLSPERRQINLDQLKEILENAQGITKKETPKRVPRPAKEKDGPTVQQSNPALDGAVRVPRPRAPVGMR